MSFLPHDGDQKLSWNMLKNRKIETIWGFFLAHKSALLPDVTEGKRNHSLCEALTLVRLTDCLTVLTRRTGEDPKDSRMICSLSSSPVRLTSGKYMLFCTSNEKEIMQHPPWEEFELRCPWLCGASILHMKSSEAKSLSSNVMLESGFTLNCKIYQRFCLKGADLQEDSWSAYLIRGNTQYFPLFFYSFGLIFVYVCRIYCGN